MIQIPCPKEYGIIPKIARENWSGWGCDLRSRSKSNRARLPSALIPRRSGPARAPETRRWWEGGSAVSRGARGHRLSVDCTCAGFCGCRCRVSKQPPDPLALGRRRIGPLAPSPALRARSLPPHLPPRARARAVRRRRLPSGTRRALFGARRVSPQRKLQLSSHLYTYLQSLMLTRQFPAHS